MKHIAICTNCMVTQNKLENIICNYYDKLKIAVKLFNFSDGNSFLDSCKHNKYDFIIMHYELTNSTGIEVAKKYQKKYKTQTPVLFITCYGKCNSVIFPSHTFGYIVQPFKASDITNILNELLQMQNDDPVVKEIFFKTTEGLICLSIQDILYFEYKDRKVEIVLPDKRYITHDTIKNIKNNKLTNDFIQSHSAFIINLSKIKLLNKNNFITMNDDSILPLAKSRAKEFRKNFRVYLEKKKNFFIK